MHSVLQLSLVLSPTPVKRHGWRLDSARGCNSKAEAPWSSETGLACSRCFSHRGRDSYRMLDDNGSVVWLALAVMTQLDNIQLMCVVSEEISLGIIYVNRAATTDYFHHWFNCENVTLSWLPRWHLQMFLFCQAKSLKPKDIFQIIFKMIQTHYHSLIILKGV